MKHIHAYCVGNYDFNKIALYARMRFIEGVDILELFKQTPSHRERQEISLVANLSTSETAVEELQLTCPYTEQCKVTNCHERIKEIIESNLH